MDDDRLRSLLLDLYEEGAQDPPPMPRPAPAPVRERRARWRWLLPASVGIAAAAVLAVIFVALPGGSRTPVTASGNAASQSSTAAASPAAPKAAAQPRASSQSASAGANSAAGPFAACDARKLQASYAAGASEGETTVITVRNPGPSTCVLAGYPSVTLSGSGRQLAISYQNGGPPLRPQANPQRVELAPGAAAHFVVARAGCQVASGTSITGLTYATAGSTSAVIPVPDTVPRLQYCAAAGSGSNTVWVGPFAPGATP